MWKAPAEMHRVEIARVRQHLAHALRRPGLDIGADPAQPLDLGCGFHRRCRSSRRAASRAPDRRRACRFPRSCAAHSRRPFRQRPELLGVIEPDALDHAVDRARESPAARSRYCARTPPRPRGRLPAPPPTSRAAPPRAPRSGPASPAPITQTSTSRSKFRRGRSGLATRVASYQPAAVFSSSLIGHSRSH